MRAPWGWSDGEQLGPKSPHKWGLMMKVADASHEGQGPRVLAPRTARSAQASDGAGLRLA